MNKSMHVKIQVCIVTTLKTQTFFNEFLGDTGHNTYLFLKMPNFLLRSGKYLVTQV